MPAPAIARGLAPMRERGRAAALPRGRRLAILHLITRLERGGSSDCTLLQAIGAARRGHRVTLLSGETLSPSPLIERARAQSGITFRTIPDLIRRPSPLRDLAALIAIARILRESRFDILHTHTSKAGVLGRLAARLTPSRPAVLHQPHGHLFYGYYGVVGTALVTLAERILAPLTDRTITLSRRGTEEHLRRGIGRPGDYASIPSGVDLGPFRRAARRREPERARLGCRPSDVLVGTLCRLEPIKGVEDLLAAFALAAPDRPSLRLHLAGDGPLAGALEGRVRALGLAGRVTIARSWVPPETILPALDLFVLASHNEGMGRVLIEAMACGRPIVATSVGGVPEVLEEGRCGLLVPPSDARAIADAILRISGDTRLSSTLSERGRRRALSFGAGRMNRELLRLYRSVAP